MNTVTAIYVDPANNQRLEATFHSWASNEIAQYSNAAAAIERRYPTLFGRVDINKVAIRVH